MLKQQALIFLLAVVVADAAAYFEEENHDVDWFEDQNIQNEAVMFQDEDPTKIPEGALDIEGNLFDISRVTTILVVRNGGKWGTWSRDISFCPVDTWAAGYSMKIEPEQKRFVDDTSLNGIRIICKYKDGVTKEEVTSTVGPWGDWGEPVFCKERNESTDFLTAFSLQVQSPRGWFKDDTAANYVKFDCRGLDQCNMHAYVLNKPPNHGFWGKWGDLSIPCPEKSAICGIKTKVEKKQPFGVDDTALNDAIFYCCN
ncbi:Vitelline membrane outer layer protein 1 [Mactra antiquata]